MLVKWLESYYSNHSSKMLLTTNILVSIIHYIYNDVLQLCIVSKTIIFSSFLLSFCFSIHYFENPYNQQQKTAILLFLIFWLIWNSNSPLKYAYFSSNVEVHILGSNKVQSFLKNLRLIMQNIKVQHKCLNTFDLYKTKTHF